VGWEVADGVIAQLKSTVPVNEPDGARDRVKFALWPGLIVCDDEPEPAPIVKLADEPTITVTKVSCWLLDEAPVTVIE
jgi:hypothetical protein